MPHLISRELWPQIKIDGLMNGMYRRCCCFSIPVGNPVASCSGSAILLCLMCFFMATIWPFFSLDMRCCWTNALRPSGVFGMLGMSRFCGYNWIAWKLLGGMGVLSMVLWRSCELLVMRMGWDGYNQREKSAPKSNSTLSSFSACAAFRR